MTWVVRVMLAAAVACAPLVAGPVVARPRLDSWATVINERHGFAIAYPVDVFEQKEAPKTDEGGVFISKDGKAKLLVGAF